MSQIDEHTGMRKPLRPYTELATGLMGIAATWVRAIFSWLVGLFDRILRSAGHLAQPHVRARLYDTITAAAGALSERLVVWARRAPILIIASWRRARARALTARQHLILRWVLAGPVTVIVAVLALMGMPVYLPRGAGNVDHLVIPLVLFPIIWAALFFHAVLDHKLKRVATVAAFVAIANIGLLTIQFSG